ncbi:hypothetical protein HS088_TW09G00850 [Tripterygium wilfordii]|uniref:Replication factor A C-terminal domain-containing protein n=1 Tax=Tripterygium wilfordii TaxID=458696 RepID=A0A7J7D8U7_TRIWF|nr:replication protein A 70 kDa DNA-binding subunit-like [Tripterygium wilfordii]XP_038710948.1 replication protein A 70 kDa DNA-binding subunit-like [Tripterygium wilfordii]XP_038710949.1 replication protein A 70 kDa DNA-binding subunit-like [Tripterygium wilfordii]KAF5742790.1 hypothetical protein HS088_TW09G00850 [Tripterygium wilfordii]
MDAPTLLAQLQLGQRGCKVICRVTKIWDSTNPTMQDELMSVDFIMVDHEKTAIQRSIRKEDAPRIKELIREGEIYTFSNLIVTDARKKFCVCPHKLMIRIGSWSIIKQMVNPALQIPIHSFSLVDDSNLDARLYNDIELTDILGHLNSMTELTYAFINGREVAKKNLIIQTTSLRHISVTLWGTNAQTFDEKEVLQLAQKHPVIGVLTAMTVRAFQGQTTLSSTSATRIYLDLQIEEVIAFRNSLGHQLQTTSLAKPYEDKHNDADATMNSKKIISQLLNLHRTTDLGKKFICEATIKQIDTSKGWWYNACPKCRVGVTNYHGVLSCRKCGPIQNLPIPWYKLQVIVTDASGDAKFFLFGKHVEKLIKLPASEFTNLPSSERNTLPSIFHQICGKAYTFTVSINEREIAMPDLTFNVAEVIIDRPTGQPETEHSVHNNNTQQKRTRESNIQDELPMKKKFIPQAEDAPPTSSKKPLLIEGD